MSDDHGVEDDEHPAGGRDALAALEPAGHREHVADHGGDAERERAAPPGDGEADPAGDRALAEVGDQDDQAGLPAHEPGDVRGPGVARPLLRHVVAARPGHEERARERPEEVGGNRSRIAATVAHRSRRPYSRRWTQPASRERGRREEGRVRCGTRTARVPAAAPRRPLRTKTRSNRMPTYEYACAKCGEHSRCTRPSARAPEAPPRCGGSAPEGVLPGRDRAQGLRLLQDRQPDASRAKSKASEKSESSESKSDTKTETKSDTQTRSRTPSRLEVGHQVLVQRLVLEAKKTRASRRRSPPDQRRPRPRPCGPALPPRFPPFRSCRKGVSHAPPLPACAPALGRRRDRRRGHRRLRRRHPRVAAPPGPGLRAGPHRSSSPPATCRSATASAPRTSRTATSAATSSRARVDPSRRRGRAGSCAVPLLRGARRHRSASRRRSGGTGATAPCPPGSGRCG